MNKKISCIIPAYNEGARISRVLDLVSVHPLIDEVIVIDDGSIDNTKEVIGIYKNRFEKIKIIIHHKNSGKSASLYDGISQSTGDYVFFLDADLFGLTGDNVTELINPIINDIADVSISLRRNAPRLWHMIGLDYISGERVLPRGIFKGYLDKILILRPFGFEVFLNSLIIKSKLRVKVILWPNVDSPYKISKNGFWRGIIGDIFMILDIFRTVSVFGPIYQIIKIKHLLVR